MNNEQAVALRKPFDAKHVGKLPKPYKKDSPKANCPECHSYHGMPAAHLDYVGHAAVTDRLLSIDPEWNWEPVAFDEHGNPAFTAGKGFWIKLTVCGVTRYGFGDGMSVKECIGDAIRNAAMRFGVALDLWGKEELEQANGPVSSVVTPTPAPAVSAADFLNPAADVGGAIAVNEETGEVVDAQVVTDHPAADGVDPRLTRRMFAAFRDAGFTDDARSETGRARRLEYIGKVIGRPVESSKELTGPEVAAVADALTADAQDAQWSEAGNA